MHRNKNFRPKKPKGHLKKYSLKKNDTESLKKYITPGNIYKGVLISGVLGLLGTAAYKHTFPTKVLDKQEIQKKIQDEIKEIEIATNKCYSELVEMEKKEEEKLDKFFEILDEQIDKRKKTAYELDKILKSYINKKLNKGQFKEEEFKTLNTQSIAMKKNIDELDKVSKSYYNLKKNKDKDIKYQFIQDDKLYSLGELNKCIKLKESIQERYSLKISDLMKRINNAEKSTAIYGYNIQKYTSKLGL